MTDEENDRFIQSLPAELDLALRNTTWRALSTMNSLRMAVRDHVHDECDRGLCQSEIDDGLRSMISSCGPSLDNIEYSATRTDEVLRQVMKWSASYYRPRT